MPIWAMAIAVVTANGKNLKYQRFVTNEDNFVQTSSHIGYG